MKSRKRGCVRRFLAWWRSPTCEVCGVRRFVWGSYRYFHSQAPLVRTHPATARSLCGDCWENEEHYVWMYLMIQLLKLQHKQSPLVELFDTCYARPPMCVTTKNYQLLTMQPIERKSPNA